jgi:hypothetical protein
MTAGMSTRKFPKEIERILREEEGGTMGIEEVVMVVVVGSTMEVAEGVVVGGLRGSFVT